MRMASWFIDFKHLDEHCSCCCWLPECPTATCAKGIVIGPLPPLTEEVKNCDEHHLRPVPTVRTLTLPIENCWLSKQPGGLPTRNVPNWRLWAKPLVARNEAIQPLGMEGYHTPRFCQFTIHCVTTIYSVILLISCDLAKNFPWMLIYFFKNPETTRTRRVWETN